MNTTLFTGARAVWHRINPVVLKLRTHADRSRAHVCALPTKWLRRNWLQVPRRTCAGPRVAVVTVNFNTVEQISHLVFSLYRILGADQFCRLIVVDNASTDGSRELLGALREAGLADVILNSRQRYHGPALNQALNHLTRVYGNAPVQRAEFVWILDSDTIVLRPDAVCNAIEEMRFHRAGLLGELQRTELSEGYAHPSSILMDPARVWRRGIDVFEDEGTPARRLHASLRGRGIPICDFPYRSAQYVLHLGRATLRAVHSSGDSGNRYHQWATMNHGYDYHGNPYGAEIYAQFLQLFKAEAPAASRSELIAACTRSGKVTLSLPSQSADFGRRRGDVYVP